MNINAASTQFSNAVTPFAASPSSELTNPVNASPMPPIKQAQMSERAGDRDPRQAQTGVPPTDEDETSSESDVSESPSQETKNVAGQELTEQELAIVMQLKARDREVRAHEQAHEAVGGQYAGAASYEYDQGPDGVRYAVAGEVPIRLPSGEGDPEQKMRQAEQVIRAALAPAEPSSQDRAVAAKAMQLKSQAQVELREQADLSRQPEAGTDENTDSEAAARTKVQSVYQNQHRDSIGSLLHNRV